MATTMKDVAKRAGVDVSTVSLAINNDPRIRTETRARIVSIAQELGYQKNHLARGLRSGKSFTVGAVVAPGDRAWCEMLAGAQGALAEHDYHLMLDIAATAARTEETQVDSLRAKRVDGLLIAPTEGETETIAGHLLPLYQSLREQTPVVLMERTLPGDASDSVTVDNHLAGRMACEHLLSLGHRRIAFVYAPHRDSTAGQARRGGYVEVLQEAGLAPLFWPVATSSMEGEEAHASLIEFLGNGDGATALVVANDTLAMVTFRALHNAGHKVPTEMALVSFGGAATRDLCPALSIISLPLEDVGRHAARLLMRRIEGDTSPVQHVLLPPTLTIAATCGGGAIK